MYTSQDLINIMSNMPLTELGKFVKGIKEFSANYHEKFTTDYLKDVSDLSMLIVLRDFSKANFNPDNAFSK